MDWILHLDTDELIHPAGSASGEYSLRKLLRDIPRDVDMVVFPNYVSLLFYFYFYFQSCILKTIWYWIIYMSTVYLQESSVERDDIKDPFIEVLFLLKHYLSTPDRLIYYYYYLIRFQCLKGTTTISTSRECSIRICGKKPETVPQRNRNMRFYIFKNRNSRYCFLF